MLSLEEVRRLARLARLGLSAEEALDMQAQLNGVLAMIEQMNAVDTSGVEPMSHPQEVPLRLREDRVTESDQRELFQGVAPATADGFYLVPKVIE